MKKLLTIDNPTRTQIRETFHRYRVEKSGLMTPEYCNGCGETFGTRRVVIYFGQEFCARCVEQWTGHAIK